MQHIERYLEALGIPRYVFPSIPYCFQSLYQGHAEAQGNAF